MSTPSDRFIRAQNIKHYRDLLTRPHTQAEREKIQKLLDEEQRTQANAGDADLQQAS